MTVETIVHNKAPTGGKNLKVQLYVEGGNRKNKKADPVIVKPGSQHTITLWPGIAFEVTEETTETEDQAGE